MSDGVKAALVTGGAQGIGKCIALWLLEAGYAVAIADADIEAGQEAERELAGKGAVCFVPCDVAEEPQAAACVGTVVREFGRLDALVNDAGIASPPRVPVEALPLAEWNRIIGVNLTGAFLTVKHAVPHLRAVQGAIVNIASTRALQSEANTEPYSASKGGLVALTHALAVSLGPAIRVNCVSPGWIDVSGWKKSSRRGTAPLSEADHAQHPAGRVGVPADIAEMVLYLLSDAAGFVTSQNFVVDGGMTKKMIYVE
jgi:NAD(P)-dependent dehydrogenase (short-subunit alcohol dehydrogenase family)